MKNKNVLISLICVAAVLLLVILGLACIFLSGNNMAKVRCVVTEHGLIYMVYHDRLVLLNYDGDIELNTGDKIFVVFDIAFAESFPEQTRTHMIVKISDGSVDDISLSEEYREQIGQLGLVIE